MVKPTETAIGSTDLTVRDGLACAGLVKAGPIPRERFRFSLANTRDGGLELQMNYIEVNQSYRRLLEIVFSVYG
jgi:hypothetical protein